MNQNLKEKYMKEALKEADKALLIDEVPIGCVIVKDDKIIARAHNVKESKKDATCHAEIIAIKKASKKLDAWRLEGCDVYITLEPCIMCSGALIQSRVKSINFGAYDLKGGGLGSSINVLEAQNINHHPIVEGGILLEECSSKISKYFKGKRK